MSTGYPLLDNIHLPTDLKRLSVAQLPTLAEEMRAFLIQSLNESGGHFAANLGAVDLTIALHYVFETPYDKLVWDVGHQAYPHKMLTGRKNQLSHIRQKDGLAPFPRREESEYDCFSVGHSSTSISAALGMSIAAQLNQETHHSVAIIGDGGMTAGLSFEALNHAGDLKTNLLVILNDNEMSISENVGALSKYLTRILSGKAYTTIRSRSKKILAHMPPILEFAKRTEEHLKGMIMPGTLFEELGFNYVGPIDGHDLPDLVRTLNNIKNLPGPQFLHVITKKGKGYPPAELDPIKYHAVSKNYLATIHNENNNQKPISASSPLTKSFSQIFGDWLCETALTDPRIVGITPAMREGSGLVEFAKKFPARYFDVGIAEQHSVTLAAGLACDKIKPVVAIYSSFLQRAYDQLIHDVALQNLPVLFAIDRAGVVADGPTHFGTFDLSFLRCIPNMLIMTPTTGNECRQMLTTGIAHNGPSAVRYPRDNCVDNPAEFEKPPTCIPLGKALITRQYNPEHNPVPDFKIAFLCFGTLIHPALKIAERLNATVVNMRFVKPIDESMIIHLAKQYDLLVTLEENVIMGGAGSAVLETLNQQQLTCPVLQLGIPDYYIEHGAQLDMLKACGLDEQSIEQAVQQKINALLSTGIKTGIKLEPSCI
jgi:1-deoxy-D-xylulose-5-phosphate synthase